MGTKGFRPPNSRAGPPQPFESLRTGAAALPSSRRNELQVRDGLKILFLDQQEGFLTSLWVGQQQFRQGRRPARRRRFPVVLADILAEKLGGVLQQDVAIGIREGQLASSRAGEMAGIE